MAPRRTVLGRPAGPETAAVVDGTFLPPCPLQFLGSGLCVCGVRSVRQRGSLPADGPGAAAPFSPRPLRGWAVVRVGAEETRDGAKPRLPGDFGNEPPAGVQAEEVGAPAGGTRASGRGRWLPWGGGTGARRKGASLGDALARAQEIPILVPRPGVGGGRDVMDTAVSGTADGFSEAEGTALHSPRHTGWDTAGLLGRPRQGSHSVPL